MGASDDTDELIDLLERLHWSSNALAEALSINSSSARRWVSGSGTTPPAVLAWLRELAGCIDRHPPPPKEG